MIAQILLDNCYYSEAISLLLPKKSHEFDPHLGILFIKFIGQFTAILCGRNNYTRSFVEDGAKTNKFTQIKQSKLKNQKKIIEESVKHALKSSPLQINLILYTIFYIRIVDFPDDPTKNIPILQMSWQYTILDKIIPQDKLLDLTTPRDALIFFATNYQHSLNKNLMEYNQTNLDEFEIRLKNFIAASTSILEHEREISLDRHSLIITHYHSINRLASVTTI